MRDVLLLDPSFLSLASIVAGVGSLFLGALVVLRERASPEGLSFFVLALVCGVWLLFFSSVYLASDPGTARFNARLAYVAVPLIPPAAYLFAQVILGTAEARKERILAVWILGMGFVGLALGTDLLLAGIHQYSWGAYPLYGPAGLPFLFFFFFVLGKVVWDLLLAWIREVEGVRRSRLGWMTGGLALACTGVVDFLPKSGVDVPPLGFAGMLAFLLVSGWTVFRYPLAHLSARIAAGRILDTVADAVLMCDRDGRIRLANPAVKEVLGYDPGDLVGQGVSMFNLSNHSSDHDLWHLIRKGELRDQEVAVPGGHGERVEVSVSTSHFRDARGGWAGSVAILRDIRRRKSLERQLHQAQKMEEIGRLAAGIAHDFNNILSAIGVHAQLLLSEVDSSSSLAEDLREIHHAVVRASDLTGQLLQFGRAQDRHPAKLEPGEVVKRLTKLISRGLGGDVELTVDLNAEGALVEADPVHIEQILMNLVVNARDAMPEGGQLRVAVLPERVSEEQASTSPGLLAGDYVTLSVEDTGTGMDDDVQNRIFEPFYTTKKRGEGTGLGLATVYGIVKQNKGHIQVASELGRGTRFTVRFPRVWEHGGEEEEAPAAEGDTKPTNGRAG